MLTVTQAGQADVPAVARVLASAFSEDPVMGPLITGRRRDARFRALFEALLRSGARAGMRVDAARDEHGRVVGAATWEPPGRRVTFLQQLPELPAYLRAVGMRGFFAGVRLELALARCRPRAPHWYLAELGVCPDRRGTGVGSALLRSRLATIDAEQYAAYLESSSPRNRSLYRRFGFTATVRITRVPHAEPAGMWRAPRNR
ncbi:GCN5-like N-acetyltransferase [Leucobacter sp. Psy1]|uniref:GNAT family N-acetyltransferase n=1 Tax=Leucobacter sp. Psy1 TaxID=2875729 RepID=UPI001CD356F2|nr:GNAT family N-acetyltransferase [Leucobacter sp. Psy1]UBH05317.1 GCN5-like N-acetyltransferase [Leucobacter sp. Psy1]